MSGVLRLFLVIYYTEYVRRTRYEYVSSSLRQAKVQCSCIMPIYTSVTFFFTSLFSVPSWPSPAPYLRNSDTTLIRGLMAGSFLPSTVVSKICLVNGQMTEASNMSTPPTINRVRAFFFVARRVHHFLVDSHRLVHTHYATIK